MHGRDLWPIKADLSQLEQVIINLAVNAPRRHAGRRHADHPHLEPAGRSEVARVPLQAAAGGPTTC